MYLVQTEVYPAKKTLVAAVVFVVIKVEGIKVLSSKIDILHGMRRVFIF